MDLETKYDCIIREIASRHHKGLICPDGSQWQTILPRVRDQLVTYMQNNQRHIEDILADIGYLFATCINYSAFEEVLSIIKGVPYTRQIPEGCKEIEVKFYDFLLTSKVLYFKEFIQGDYYDAKFNAYNGEFTVEGKYKLTLSSDVKTSWNYNILTYGITEV